MFKKTILSHPRTNILILFLLFLPLMAFFFGNKAGLYYRTTVKTSATSVEKSKVALVKWPSGNPTETETEQMVQQGLNSALGSGGFNSLVAGKRVVIKVNLGNSCDRWEVTGGPVVKAVVNALKAANAASITIGEGRDNFGNGIENCAGAGYGGLAGVQYVNFLTAPTRVVNVANGLWPSSENLIMPQVYLDADVIISVPKMKTHNRTGVTVGLKNVFGVPPISVYNFDVDIGATVLWRERFHDLATAKSITHINMGKPPNLVVTDAINVGEGVGPWGCREKVMNSVIVSTDPVAADAVATSIMGFSPENTRHLVYGSFKGLGNYEMDYIDVLGSTISSVKQDFLPSPSDPDQYGKKVVAMGSLPSGYSLDGNIGEWFAVKRPVKMIGAGTQVWAAQDGNKLYLAAVVLDGQLDSQDGLKVYFSQDDQNDRQQDVHSTYQSDDFKIVLPYSSFCSSPCSARMGNISGGYTVEIEMPFSQLGGFPGLNEEVGFDFGVINNGTLVVWGGNLEVENNPSKMGVALLTSGLGPPPLVGQSPTQAVTPSVPTQTPTATITPMPTQTVTVTPTGPALTPTASITPTPTTPATPPTATPTQNPVCACPAGVPQKNLGNANCDNAIDGIDFEIWREELTGLRTTSTANFDCANGVNQADFDIWRQNRSQ